MTSISRFRTIKESLLRTPLLLLADTGALVSPEHQRQSWQLGQQHASSGRPMQPGHPRVADPRSYMAGYAHQRRSPAQPTGSGPRPARPRTLHPVYHTPAGRLLQRRRCFDQGETQRAVSGISRSLAQIKSKAVVSGHHERQIRDAQQAALSAHPEEAPGHIKRAVELMKQFYQKSPGRPDLQKRELTPTGKDPRLGHLFYGTPKAPEAAPRPAQPV